MGRSRRGRWVFASLIALFLIIAVLIRNRPAEEAFDVDLIRPGTTHDAVAGIIGDRGIFQFRIADGVTELECYSFEFAYGSRRYYFVFRNDALEDVHTPSDFHQSETVPYRGGFKEIETPWNTSDKIDQVLAADGLPILKFAKEVVLAREERESESILDSNIWPIALFFPLFPPGEAESERSVVDSILKKVKLGDSKQDLLRELGRPKFRSGTSNGEMLAFGPLRSISQNSDGKISIFYRYRRDWLWVLLRVQQVEILASDGFLSTDAFVIE